MHGDETCFRTGTTGYGLYLPPCCDRRWNDVYQCNPHNCNAHNCNPHQCNQHECNCSDCKTGSPSTCQPGNVYGKWTTWDIIKKDGETDVCQKRICDLDKNGKVIEKSCQACSSCLSGDEETC